MSIWRKNIMVCGLLVMLALNSKSGLAQNLVNEKIQIAADALTVLKFNGEITHCELGMRDGFTCLVRDNDNTIVIKTLDPGPASTNLAITEGKRTHYFILVFLKQVDINNTKLFYDYSDLKALKKLVAKKGTQSTSEVAVVESTTAEIAPKKSKKEEAAEKKRLAAEQKKVDEEVARAQEQERVKALAIQQEKEQQKQLVLAKEAEKKSIAAEKVRRAKEAKDAAATAKAEQAAAKAKDAEDKKLAANKKKVEENPGVGPKSKDEGSAPKTKQEEEPKKLSRKEEREMRKQKEREEAEAVAKAEEARKQEEAAAAAKEKARVDELERIQMIALEKDRKKTEALQKQKEIAAAKAREKEDARLKQQEIAKAKAAEKEAARIKQQELAAEQAAKRKAEQDRQNAIAAAIAKEKANPLAFANLRKKYPSINFADIPEGQMIAGEYYQVADTLENHAQSMKLLSGKPELDIASNTVEGINMRLEAIAFSGVNSYLRVRIRNGSKKEFLVGKMILRWYKADGKGLNLFACYVTRFPVIAAGEDATIVYAARGVNAQDGDKMYFSMTDRVQEANVVEIPFSGKVYNKVFMRK